MTKTKPANYWIACLDCFPKVGSGRDVPEAPLVFTADQLFHSLDFEDDHVVQMRCEARYLHNDVASIGSMPRNSRTSGKAMAIIGLTVVLLLLIGMWWAA